MKRTILTVLIMLGMLVLGTTGIFALNQGAVWGAFIKYKSSTEVYITSGSGRCNSNEWNNYAETSLNLYSVLPTGEDFVYIYVDDDGSTYPDSPVFIGSLTEPAWSDSKSGWYNGNDRCIGVVWCDSSGNIVQFQNNSNLEYMAIKGSGLIKKVLSNGNPNGSYQNTESTAYTPVNTTGIYVIASNTDSNSQVYLYVVPYENQYMSIRDIGYGSASASGWLNIERGWSRDLQWNGADNDDNSFSISIVGFRIER